MQRRTARQQRRQIDRRRRRRLNVFRILQQYRLLPCGPREQVFAQLDAQLRCRYPETEILPYLLRARALDAKLDPTKSAARPTTWPSAEASAAGQFAKPMTKKAESSNSRSKDSGRRFRKADAALWASTSPS